MSASGQPRLSDDEVRLLGLVCEGLTNQEIAVRVGVTEAAVAIRISGILHRLGLRNRVQLAVWTVKQGLY